MIDDLHDIFFESLQSIYPPTESLNGITVNPLKRADSLVTPDKNELQSHGDVTTLPSSPGQMNLNHLWDTIYNENDEFGSDHQHQRQQVNVESQQSFQRAMTASRTADDGDRGAEAVDGAAVQSVATRHGNAMTAKEKERILKNVDLNKLMKTIRHNRK